jgi:hypothetical protein
MNESLKGALLSALVFPGIGHLMLRHYRRGVALILMTLAGLLIVVVKATEKAFAILEQIEFEGLPLDMTTLSHVATQASRSPDGFAINFALLLITLSWFVGVFDAYRLGKRSREKNNP